MKLTDKQQKIIDIIQWICIIVLLMVSILFYIKRDNNKGIVTDTEYQKEQTFVKIYESQEISALKKQNQELYDSIKKLSNVEYAVEIRYKYKYKTDTITVKEFISTEAPTIQTDSLHQNVCDSIYHYTNDNDTIRHDITIKARDLKWVTDEFSINDKFTIINRETNDVNETIINHSPNMEIQGVDTWHRTEKEKWYQRFILSPQVGVGYGVFNNKVDLYVGFGVGYRF